jgi:hypothetical protein
MTAVHVKKSIQTARQDGKITAREAKQIIKAAEKTPAGDADKVTNVEAKRVGEFFERRTARPGGVGGPPPGATWNPPPPGSPLNPDMTQAARKEFNQFFIRQKLPYGENEEAMRGRMQASLERTGLGDKLPRAPRTAALHEVPLHDRRPVDGDRQVAFYDAEKKTFFVRADGGGRANQGERWHGPFEFNDRPTVSVNPPRPR